MSKSLESPMTASSKSPHNKKITQKSLTYSLRNIFKKLLIDVCEIGIRKMLCVKLLYVSKRTRNLNVKFYYVPFFPLQCYY